MVSFFLIYRQTGPWINFLILYKVLHLIILHIVLNFRLDQCINKLITTNYQPSATPTNSERISLEDGEKNLDNRLKYEGFQRSPNQLYTLRDGNCGVRAILHLLNTVPEYMVQDMYDGEDHTLFRRMVCHHFVHMVNDGRLFYSEGNVIQWMKSMKNTGTFIDHYWLLACAQMLGRDIVLIPSFTQSSTDIGRIIRIQGSVN